MIDKNLKFANGKLPVGLHVVTGVSWKRRLVTTSNTPAWEFIFRVPEWRLYLHWYVSESPKAAWVWQPFADSWAELPSRIIDHTFIVKIVKHEWYDEGKKEVRIQNQIKEFLVEVLP